MYLIGISHADKIRKLYNLKRSDVSNYFFKFILCRIFPCLCKIEVYNKIIVNLYCTNTQFKIIITTYPLLKRELYSP